MQTLAPCEGPQSPVLTSLREVPKRPRHFVYSSSAVMPVADTGLVSDDSFGGTSSAMEAPDSSLPLKSEYDEYEHVQPPSENIAETTKETPQAHFEDEAVESAGYEPQLNDSHQFSLQPDTPMISLSTTTDTSESQIPEDALEQAEQDLSLNEADLRTPLTSIPQAPASDLAASLNPQEDACSTCQVMSNDNDRLTRLVARLRMRIIEIRATSQTHGQRLLRAAYQDRMRDMNNEHAQKTAEMLNKQKTCFEEELEALEKESHAAIHTLHIQLERERMEKERLKRAFENERDEAIEKTNITMQAVQRKMAHLHAKVIRLERENAVLSASQKEKQVMVEVLASASAARDVERREREMISKAEQEERNRKNMLIDNMHAEIKQLRARLFEETECRRALLNKIEEMHDEREDEKDKHAEDLAHCKKQSKKENDRLGRLFASVIQDFANVQSDVSTND
ncbi:hypothetical protein FGB62_59g18 [Gracilaria domingensis]|nr:hypothetical protein FGB62_59g18 [Gracilaria domingensis]